MLFPLHGMRSECIILLILGICLAHMTFRGIYMPYKRVVLLTCYFVWSTYKLIETCIINAMLCDIIFILYLLHLVYVFRCGCFID